jgi:hypothetical protein
MQVLLNDRTIGVRRLPAHGNPATRQSIWRRLKKMKGRHPDIEIILIE